MNKSGLTSVLDRATGEFLGAFSVPEVRTWIAGITEDGKLVGRNEPQLGKTTTICPSALGAKSWNSMAFSPRTGYQCNDITPSNRAPEAWRHTSVTGAYNDTELGAILAYLSAVIKP